MGDNLTVIDEKGDIWFHPRLILNDLKFFIDWAEHPLRRHTPKEWEDYKERKNVYKNVRCEQNETTNLWE